MLANVIELCTYPDPDGKYPVPRLVETASVTVSVVKLPDGKGAVT